MIICRLNWQRWQISHDQVPIRLITSQGKIQGLWILFLASLNTAFRVQSLNSASHEIDPHPIKTLSHLQIVQEFSLSALQALVSSLNSKLTDFIFDSFFTYYSFLIMSSSLYIWQFSHNESFSLSFYFIKLLSVIILSVLHSHIAMCNSSSLVGVSALPTAPKRPQE